MLLPVGYPASDATVPDLKRKHLDDILVHVWENEMSSSNSLPVAEKSTKQMPDEN